MLKQSSAASFPFQTDKCELLINKSFLCASLKQHGIVYADIPKF